MPRAKERHAQAPRQWNRSGIPGAGERPAAGAGPRFRERLSDLARSTPCVGGAVSRRCLQPSLPLAQCGDPRRCRLFDDRAPRGPGSAASWPPDRAGSPCRTFVWCLSRAAARHEATESRPHAGAGRTAGPDAVRQQHSESDRDPEAIGDPAAHRGSHRQIRRGRIRAGQGGGETGRYGDCHARLWQCGARTRCLPPPVRATPGRGSCERFSGRIPGIGLPASGCGPDPPDAGADLADRRTAQPSALWLPDEGTGGTVAERRASRDRRRLPHDARGQPACLQRCGAVVPGETS